MIILKYISGNGGNVLSLEIWEHFWAEHLDHLDHLDPGHNRNGEMFNAVVLPAPFLAAANSSFVLSFTVSSVIAWGNHYDFRGAQQWKDVQQLDTKGCTCGT